MDKAYVFDNDHELAGLHHEAVAALLDRFTQYRISGLIDLKGKRCLEVAAGTGSIAVWLADQVGPDGSVLATDLKPRAIPLRGNLTVMEHDITGGTPLGEDYDLIHVRLLLNHLPQRRHILHRLATALRPGGVLLTEDYSPTRSIDLVIHARTIEDATLLEQFQATHYRVLTSHGNDRAWSRHAVLAMMEEGLIDVQAVMHGETWRGSRPGCQFMAAGVVQLRGELVAFGMADAQLDRVVELLDDPGLLLHGHILYSTSSHKA
jgi:2-polyprenyl-3-methyl-5-hydroxy-6-metoxy-1,4-benzoquinol methylase